jgi:7-cyano-7-deazaguanine synthase in queuosine biosynthesis
MRDDAALVLFCGGQDSATCLAWSLARFAHVETLGFDCGQRHRVELAQRAPLLAAMLAAQPSWRDRLGPDHLLELSTLGRLSDTSLTRERAIAIRAHSHSCHLGDRTPLAWGAGCGACPACALREAGWARFVSEARGSEPARDVSPP